MTYDEAVEVLQAIFPDVPTDASKTSWTPYESKLRNLSGDEKRRASQALATIWRQDSEHSGFVQPGADLVELVQETIGESPFGSSQGGGGGTQQT